VSRTSTLLDFYALNDFGFLCAHPTQDAAKLSAVIFMIQIMLQIWKANSALGNINENLDFSTARLTQT
jgi:hypothetical protein